MLTLRNSITTLLRSSRISGESQRKVAGNMSAIRRGGLSRRSQLRRNLKVVNLPTFARRGHAIDSPLTADKKEHRGEAYAFREMPGLENLSIYSERMFTIRARFPSN